MLMQISLMINAIQEHSVVNKIFFTFLTDQECNLIDFTIIISLKITIILKSFFINIKLIIFSSV